MQSDWWMLLQVFGFGAEKRHSISSELQLLKVGATKPSYYDQPHLPPTTTCERIIILCGDKS